MRRASFAATGALSALDPRARESLMTRDVGEDAEVIASTAAILERVRVEGDEALYAFAQQFDEVALETLEVPRRACDGALDRLEAPLRRALERAAASIAAVHAAMKPVEQVVRTADGVIIGRRPQPVAIAGVYAPGGRASYPSSLLMGAVPARVAGVGTVVACSPPGPDGLPAVAIRAACAIAGVDRLFAVGGAGAIGAMAHGTRTIPAVDRLVGPGNAYVAEAKRQVSRVTVVDAPAGPSELLIIADASADAAWLAREMLAQAEHDPDAAVVLVTLDPATWRGVRRALDVAIYAEPRASVIRAAFAARGALLEAASLEEAVAFANAYAAEHVLLALAPVSGEAALARIRAAGTVFIGDAASVAFGDYLTGANHVLPTAGAARRHSGLGTETFMRWTTWQRIDRAAAASLAPDVHVLAMAESLPAHAAAALAWGTR